MHFEMVRVKHYCPNSVSCFIMGIEIGVINSLLTNDIVYCTKTKYKFLIIFLYFQMLVKPYSMCFEYFYCRKYYFTFLLHSSRPAVRSGKYGKYLYLASRQDASCCSYIQVVSFLPLQNLNVAWGVLASYYISMSQCTVNA